MLAMASRDFDEPATAGQKAASKLGAMWSGYMHNSPMWPIHGQYQCRSCGRSYPVPWVSDGLPPARGKVVAAETSQIRQASPLRSALLPLIVVLAMLVPANIQAADALIVDSDDPAAKAFSSYSAGLAQATPWRVETIEIDASLPKIKKQGRLRAIRRLVPRGKPEYQVLDFVGDQTVRQQVIVRYLSAETQATVVPPSAVAITPANYKFSYKGPVETAGAIAYCFVITPRKKRLGRIKGELWIDGETGAVVRQSGQLVKSPSIFLKRITVTQETALHDGLAKERITHFAIDTRLVGRAELTIRERPCNDLHDAFASGIEE